MNALTERPVLVRLSALPLLASTQASKPRVEVTITCLCGMQITLWVKGGDVICTTCTCGQTLTAVVPLPRGLT